MGEAAANALTAHLVGASGIEGGGLEFPSLLQAGAEPEDRAIHPSAAGVPICWRLRIWKQP
ncbi:MAG TPA: hypothetical protein VFD49_10685 [Candidatus Dormibacteraeota bacterium]|nr:hypothetical protein [Candidatus Dormibacteraeota bacterium]